MLIVTPGTTTVVCSCASLYERRARSSKLLIVTPRSTLLQVRDHAIRSDQAKLRFVFWREVVDGLFKSQLRYDTPAVRELLQTTKGLKLSKYLFLKLIQAREKHFNECPFQTLKEAERYAEETNVSILYLICEAYGLKSVTVDHALNHLGQAQGLVNLIRGSVPLARNRRVVLLPLDVMNKHNLNQEVVLRLLRSEPESGDKADRTEEALLDMYHELASVAHQHACTAARLAHDAIQPHQHNGNCAHNSIQPQSPEDPPSDASSLRSMLSRQMLPLVPVSRYLDRLCTKARFDPRRLEAYVDGLLPLRLSWQAWRNRLPDGPRT